MASTSIKPILEIRTCKEHMCRILRKKMLWTRCLFGLLTFDAVKEPRASTTADHRGLIAAWHVNIYLRRRFGDPANPENIVLEAYCGLTADGKITGSGLMDPKDITINRKNYCQLSKKSPSCEICENGQMIPFEERFVNASYRPPTPPFSESQKAASLKRKERNRRWDLFEQSLVLRRYQQKMLA